MKPIPGTIYTASSFLANAKIEEFFTRDQPWAMDCEIIQSDDRLLIQYRRQNAAEINKESERIAKAAAGPEGNYGWGVSSEVVYLRYSRGPGQGFFWDVYGEDFHNFGLAIIAIMNAPCPVIHAREFRREVSMKPHDLTDAQLSAWIAEKMEPYETLPALYDGGQWDCEDCGYFSSPLKYWWRRFHDMPYALDVVRVQAITIKLEEWLLRYCTHFVFQSDPEGCRLDIHFANQQTVGFRAEEIGRAVAEAVYVVAGGPQE